MKFKFEIWVYQEGVLDEVLETPINEFRDCLHLAESLARFASIQSGIGRSPSVEARRYWDRQYREQNFLRKEDERVAPHLNNWHLTSFAAQINMRNYEGIEYLASGVGLSMPSLKKGYSGTTYIVLSKVIPIPEEPSRRKR